MDVIYCFGDQFSYRTPARDYEQFPIEEEKKKAQGKCCARFVKVNITQLRVAGKLAKLQNKTVILIAGE